MAIDRAATAVAVVRTLYLPCTTNPARFNCLVDQRLNSKTCPVLPVGGVVPQVLPRPREVRFRRGQWGAYRLVHGAMCLCAVSAIGRARRPQGRGADPPLAGAAKVGRDARHGRRPKPVM